MLMRNVGGGSREALVAGATDGAGLESPGCKVSVSNICQFVHLLHLPLTVY